MPTYQYACTACGDPLEAVQSFTDQALTVCPTCGGALRKVFSAVGVVFKGSGFYKNDSRKSPSGGEKKSDSGKGDVAATSDSPNKTDKGKDGVKTADAKPASTTSAPAAKTA